MNSMSSPDDVLNKLIENQRLEFSRLREVFGEIARLAQAELPREAVTQTAPVSPRPAELRKAFEKWARRNWEGRVRLSGDNMNGLHRNLDNMYVYRPIQDAWEAVQGTLAELDSVTLTPSSDLTQKRIACLDAILDSATDGREIPEWLAERIEGLTPSNSAKETE